MQGAGVEEIRSIPTFAPMSTIYTNARIFTGDTVLERGSLIVENGHIINYSPGDSKSPGEYNDF